MGKGVCPHAFTSKRALFQVDQDFLPKDSGAEDAPAKDAGLQPQTYAEFEARYTAHLGVGLAQRGGIRGALTDCFYRYFRRPDRPAHAD